MQTMRAISRAAAVSAGVLLSVLPAGADWTRDFDDGTVQGMIEYDPKEAQAGVNECTPSVVNGALRLDFNAIPTGVDDEDDSCLMIDPNPYLGDVSSKVLVRYSTNPDLAATVGDSEINGGMLLQVNLETLSAYICVMDDRGYLQLQKLTAGAIDNICPEGNVDVLEFDPTKDWWIRFEAVDDGQGGRILRSRAWVDGTDEPCEWQAQCTDATPHGPGATAIVANEDGGGNGQFLDFDNPSVSTTLTCIEICGNGLDDDQDGATDCADGDCDLHPACACPDPFADADRDNDVDLMDFALLQRCITGAGDPAGKFDVAACDCFDRDPMDQDPVFRRSIDGDGDVDATDLAAFVACSTGPDVPPNPACDD